MNKSELINSIFYPRKSNNQKDEKDHLIDIDNKISVGTRFFIHDKKFPTIIYFHANAELVHEYDSIASYFKEFNINVIVCGYRGYGLSNGEPTKDTLLSDSSIIFEYIYNYLIKLNHSGKIIIMGRSLGSAAACEILSKHEKLISGCILESGFATEYPLLNLMNIAPDSIDFTLDDGFMNLSKLKKYKKPLYLIHADLDDIIPLSQAEIIMLESGSTKKDIFKVNGANHNNIIMIAREHYFTNIRSFIDSI